MRRRSRDGWVEKTRSGPARDNENMGESEVRNIIVCRKAVNDSSYVEILQRLLDK